MTTYIETDCKFEHEGRTFESGGAVVTETHVIGYPKGRVLQDWHGNAIGTCRVLSTWRTPRSFMSSTMSSYEVFVDGKRYTGRSCGDGMILRAKLSRRQTA